MEKKSRRDLKKRGVDALFPFDAAHATRMDTEFFFLTSAQLWEERGEKAPAPSGIGSQNKINVHLPFFSPLRSGIRDQNGTRREVTGLTGATPAPLSLLADALATFPRWKSQATSDPHPGPFKRRKRTMRMRRTRNPQTLTILHRT